MKIVLNIKENANPKNGDVLEYSSKEKCFIQVPKTRYEKKLEKQMFNLESKFLKTKDQVKILAETIQNYMKGNN